MKIIDITFVVIVLELCFFSFLIIKTFLNLINEYKRQEDIIKLSGMQEELNNYLNFYQQMYGVKNGTTQNQISE